MGFFDNLFANVGNTKQTAFSGNQRSGLINIGDNPYQYSPIYNSSDDDITNVTNVYNSTLGGGITNLNPVKKTTEIVNEPSQTLEKPVSLAPALFGGGTTTATGGGDAGTNLTAIAGVVGGVLLVGGLGFVLIKSKKGKK